MIGDDGRLGYEVVPDPHRLFRHRLRHLVNPVIGIGCGLVFGAGVFLVTVQALFGVRPSIVALIVAVAAVVAYAAAVGWAHRAGRRRGHRVVVSDAGVSVAYAGATTDYPWSRFRRWLEHEDDFALVSGGIRGRTLVVLPKAGVPEEEQALLREVFHSRIDPDDDPLDEAFVEMDWHEEPARREQRGS